VEVRVVHRQLLVALRVLAALVLMASKIVLAMVVVAGQKHQQVILVAMVEGLLWVEVQEPRRALPLVLLALHMAVEVVAVVMVRVVVVHRALLLLRSFINESFNF